MHFIALCDRYPFYALNVYELKPLLEARGLTEPSTIVHFRNRVLDTRAEEFTEKEAVLIRKALERCTRDPPIIGLHIQIQEAKEARK